MGVDQLLQLDAKRNDQATQLGSTWEGRLVEVVSTRVVSLRSSRGNSWSGVWDVLLIYWALLLGNVLEWYEFAVFSFLEPYIQRHFFHDSAISTWLTFACTFIMRPVGGLALGLLGDLFGRKVSTFVSIFGMMLGTVGQGAEE
ncbi:Putative proline/betaine transporter [Durusdinium trenchii]|uniref:Proline/betaine transporter n=1 Tax=Durusdinium trenchii TaxID=1381693 RepID=A0ABP0QCH6_9DINO